MGSSPSKSDTSFREAYDPCKKEGCAVQACIYDMLNKSNKPGETMTDRQCDPQRKALEQCRQRNRAHYESIGVFVPPLAASESSSYSSSSSSSSSSPSSSSSHSPSLSIITPGVSSANSNVTIVKNNANKPNNSKTTTS